MRMPHIKYSIGQLKQCTDVEINSSLDVAESKK